MLQSVEANRADKQAPVEFVEQGAARPRPGRVTLVLKAIVQAVIALAVLFAAFQGMNRLVATKPEVAKRPVQEKSFAVTTEPVVIRDHAPIISIYGETVAGRQVDLRTLVAGEVVAVHEELKAGGQIARGDVLLAIDRFGFEGAVTEAKANLAEARARQVENEGRVALETGNVVRVREQLEFAQTDLERATELLARGSVTERTLDERKLLVSQRQQGLEQRINALALERAKVDQQAAVISRLEWRLANAERDLENTVLRAPFDAIVRSEAAQAGRMVGVNDVVASIYSRDELEVRFTLSDNQYGRLVAEAGTVVGREATVLWYLGSEPLTYTATIDRVGADVARTRGGVDVFATIELSPGSTPLRPGAFVEVSVPDQKFSASARIPEIALYGNGKVFVVTDSRMESRQVEGLALDDGYIIVRGDLSEGDELITTRIPEAGDGVLVKIVGEAPAETAQSGKE